MTDKPKAERPASGSSPYKSPAEFGGAIVNLAEMRVVIWAKAQELEPNDPQFVKLLNEYACALADHILKAEGSTGSVPGSGADGQGRPSWWPKNKLKGHELGCAAGQRDEGMFWSDGRWVCRGCRYYRGDNPVQRLWWFITGYAPCPIELADMWLSERESRAGEK